MGFRRGTPGNSCTCTSGTNTFYAPSGTNFNDVLSAGRSSSGDLSTLNANVGHFGAFDFQRDASMNQFTGAYTNASNFAVGVYMYGGGFSWEATQLVA